MNFEALEHKSYRFALRIVRMYKYLREVREHDGLSEQMMRCGTNLGANISEGVYAQASSESVDKFYSALNEANETRYWLRLLVDSESISREQGQILIDDCSELIRLLGSTIKAIGQNAKRKEKLVLSL